MCGILHVYLFSLTVINIVTFIILFLTLPWNISLPSLHNAQISHSQDRLSYHWSSPFLLMSLFKFLPLSSRLIMFPLCNWHVIFSSWCIGDLLLASLLLLLLLLPYLYLLIPTFLLFLSSFVFLFGSFCVSSLLCHVQVTDASPDPERLQVRSGEVTSVILLYIFNFHLIFISHCAFFFRREKERERERDREGDKG